MDIEHFTKTPNCSSLLSKGKLRIGIFAIISTPEAVPVDALRNSKQCSLYLCTLFTQNIFLLELWNVTLHRIPLNFNQKTCTTEMFKFGLKQKATP